MAISIEHNVKPWFVTLANATAGERQNRWIMWFTYNMLDLFILYKLLLLISCFSERTTKSELLAK